MICSCPRVNEPDIHCGCDDGLVGGTEDRSHALLNDQREAPGREQRFQRAAIEEADDPSFDRDASSRRDKERGRDRDQERPLHQTGRGGDDDLLDDIGRVSAEHHHLAVRHVDDAHHAERDGKTDRGEQQDRAERQAVIDVLKPAPVNERGFDVLYSLDGGFAHGGRFRGAQTRQETQGLLVAAVDDDRDRCEPIELGRARVLKGDRGARLCQGRLDGRNGFLADRLLDGRKRVRILCGERRLGRLCADRGIGRQQREPRIEAAQLAAQTVVDADPRELILGKTRNRGTGESLGISLRRTGGLDHDPAVGSAIEVAADERVDDVARARMSAHRERSRDLRLAIEIRVGKLGDHRLGHRRDRRRRCLRWGIRSRRVLRGRRAERQDNQSHCYQQAGDDAATNKNRCHMVHPALEKDGARLATRSQPGTNS